MSGGIGVFRNVFLREIVRFVLVLPLLVLNHSALQVQSLLAQVEEAHAVRLHPQGVVEGRRGHILEEVGAVEVSGAIHVSGADFFHRLDITSQGVLAAAKHQVFEEMREARPPRLFVSAAYVVPQVDGDDGRLVVFVHDQRKTILEHELLVRNINILSLRLCQCNGGKSSQQQ